MSSAIGPPVDNRDDPPPESETMPGMNDLLGEHLAAAGHATTPAHLRLLGLHRWDIDAALQEGRLVKVRRGAFIAPVGEDPHGVEEHRRTAAALARADGTVTLSHESAALLRGLPVLTTPARVQARRLGPGPRDAGGWGVP